MHATPIKRLARFTVVLCVAATAACVLKRADGELQSLTGADWRLVELSGREAAPMEVTRRPWIRFNTDSNRVSGSGGCNRMSGPFTLNADAMQFGALASTKMACADQALNQQEVDFFGALQSTDHYAIRGDTLVLLRGADVMARFRPAR